MMTRELSTYNYYKEDLTGKKFRPRRLKLRLMLVNRDPTLSDLASPGSHVPGSSVTSSNLGPARMVTPDLRTYEYCTVRM